MNPERWRKVEEIFEEAVDLPPGQRETFLLRAAGNDPVLRREVDSLLEAHERSGAFLEQPVVEGGISQFLADRVERLTLDHVGPYKLLRRLGEGGMSQVFLAVRDDDEYQKLVALKVIRQEMDREDLRRRFRTERQILASLDHPNIAKLLDGGTTEEGLPYFVMDYIEGIRIDEFCDRNRLSIPERLRLFGTVCSAVIYAHQNLVVHRDLKASNILVTSSGVPKLLDFGIAKLMKPEQFPVMVEFTATRMRPMTPYYASPEQIQGKLITTSSDVYSLGVLFYKLLTGQLPYRLEEATPREVEKAVLEEIPERPSARIQRLEALETDTTGTGGVQTIEAVCLSRRTQPGALRRRLAGDLDNIALMALRKEPPRRYASVEQFAEDIRRHLQGLPVVAHKDSLGYRTRKFLTRNRYAVGVATLFALFLVGVSALTAFQNSRIRLERDQAQLERDRAEQVVSFMQEIFQISDPQVTGGETVTAREILDRGARRIDQELSGQPAIQATLMEAIGNVYRNLGLLDWAEPLLRRSLELRRETFGPQHDEVAQSLNNLGVLLGQKGEFAAAEPLLREALDMRLRLHGERHQWVAESLNNLGRLFHDKGDFPTAERLYRRAIAIQQEVSGQESLELADQEINLAMLLSQEGDFDAAEALFRRVLEIRRRWLDAGHPLIANSLNDLAVNLGIQGRNDEAEPLMREALAIRRKTLGDEHMDVAESLNNLGRVMREKGDYASAERLYREALTLWKKLMGREHPKVAVQISNLAMLLRDTGKLAEAEQLFRESLEIRRNAFAGRHAEIGISLLGLGSLLVQKGDLKAAEPLLLESIEVFESTLPVNHWRTAEARSFLGECYTAEGRFEEAEELLVGSYYAIRSGLGPKHRRTRGVEERLVGLYEAWGRPEKAAEIRAAAG